MIITMFWDEDLTKKIMNLSLSVAKPNFQRNEDVRKVIHVLIGCNQKLCNTYRVLCKFL